MLSRLLPHLPQSNLLAIPTVLMFALFVTVITAWMFAVPKWELDKQARLPLDDAESNLGVTRD